MLRFIRDYLFSIIFVFVIIYLSLSNPSAIKMPRFAGWDKVVHFCMYGGLSGVIWIEFLWKYRTQKTHIKRSVIGVLLIPVLFGGLLELCQHYFTRYRSGGWLDFLANNGGVAIASFIAWFILRPLILKLKV